MELVALFIPVLLAGAAMGRWTRWHPLLIGLLIAIVPGALGLLAMAAFTTEGGAILLFGGLAFLAGAVVAALGAFAGWLRRKHVERMG